MICLLNKPRSLMLLRKLRDEKLLRTLVSVRQNSCNSSHSLPVANEVKDRISTLCSRYSPCRTTFDLQFNQYIKLKNKLKYSRYFTVPWCYIFGCFLAAQNLPMIYPDLMSDSPITFM